MNTQPGVMAETREVKTNHGQGIEEILEREIIGCSCYDVENAKIGRGLYPRKSRKSTELEWGGEIKNVRDHLKTHRATLYVHNIVCVYMYTYMCVHI